MVSGAAGVQQRKFYLSIFALCDGSFLLVKAEVTLGVDGCTNDALSVILGEQRKLYLSIFALCGGSFILVKAEVTLGVDGCTNDALSVILGNPFFSFTRVSNVEKADFSKKTHGAFCSGFSLAFICFSHVEMLWFNSLWELYQFIVFKILLNQLQFNSSGTPFHLHFISAIKPTSVQAIMFPNSGNVLYLHQNSSTSKCVPTSWPVIEPKFFQNCCPPDP
ncbi:uncharacterized protein LOC125835722 [Solanum verrucosum]|uniref:uncharacterized protein LOC125835722 n=1 Tax=Solanum verrucosum TaxID=315347 RepID=UPI0020D14C0A|nr:uncharacterized protein LOC125835722 [Solanum verrucosum]